ncbi:MAG: tRNA pseudouridine(55) synthase TruB [Anaerolineales bacterium]|nr:tRNA pseudouridine(55) synthase TruB [Anaerolineales bacterium]MCA9975314.1 tRNA pseudouridine(55) synthase TruB [Anaerolineales bacterium]
MAGNDSRMEGVLNLDKPEGMTSHDVVNRVRRVSGTRRVGHAGTLDPLATGVLLVCVGRATRLSEYLLGQSKTYVATIRLGQTTNTYDAEGEVVAERPFSHLTLSAITAALEQFRGPIQQLPPMYSAVKKNGQPLYKLARQGVEVERPLREVTIYQLDVQQWQPPDLQLVLTCSSGTYVRSLAHDLGEVLGCGGHITALRRTQVGVFSVADAVPLDNLTAETLSQQLWATDTAVSHLPQLNLTSTEADDLCQGRWVSRQAHHPQATLARAYDAATQFIGVVTGDDETWQPKKIFHP